MSPPNKDCLKTAAINFLAGGNALVGAWFGSSVIVSMILAFVGSVSVAFGSLLVFTVIEREWIERNE
jgi:hypothetical protein